jgi:Na+/H+ antiporter
MHHNLLIVLGLIFAMALLYMLSQKLRVSYPIFLVIGGLIIGFVPGMPRVAISPEIIFLIFLPPLLYEAAWFTSWNNFWRFKRSIASLAFSLVFITSTAVALVSNALIPNFSLALGFLLGGIISPPDAVAANSVLKSVSVPKRISTILEGESLINDASSLIVFRFALAAVLTGQFVFKEAVFNFYIVAVMGIVVGLVIAIIIYKMHFYLPTTPNIDALLTILTPYVMYLVAEQFHFSGVLAVVSGGLFLSSCSHRFLNYQSRIQAHSVWGSLIFLLNGLVFILIGLHLPSIADGLGEYSIAEAIYYAVLVTLTAMIVRIVYVFPNAYIPRIFSKKIREREAFPPPSLVFIVGWAGMRGVVSLAAALSIPLMRTDGTAFPQRNLILFITFVAIFMTLVFQGLTMPLIMRLLNIKEIDETTPAEQQLSTIRLDMAKISLAYLKENYPEEVKSNSKLARFRDQLEHTIRREKQFDSSDSETIERRAEAREEFNHIYLELVERRREALLNLRRQKVFEDEILREYEHTLDLEEARMRI